VAGKARVHELAKELGVTSKEVLARLSEQGEFVKSASSTVEAPVARRLRESFGGAKPAAAKVKSDGNGSPAKPAATKPTPVKAPAAATAPAAAAAAPPAAAPAPPVEAAAPPAVPTPTRPGPAPGATPGPRPGPAPKPAARTPRVGNNPFSSAQPVDRPIPRPQAPRPGAPRPGVSPGNMPPRPGGTRPAPGGRPGGPRPGQGGARPGPQRSCAIAEIAGAGTNQPDESPQGHDTHRQQRYQHGVRCYSFDIRSARNSQSIRGQQLQERIPTVTVALTECQQPLLELRKCALRPRPRHWVESVACQGSSADP